MFWIRFFGPRADRRHRPGLYSDSAFYEQFSGLFSGPPSGMLTIETLAGLSARVQTLETRLNALEQETEKKRRS